MIDETGNARLERVFLSTRSPPTAARIDPLMDLEHGRTYDMLLMPDKSIVVRCWPLSSLASS